MPDREKEIWNDEDKKAAWALIQLGCKIMFGTNWEWYVNHRRADDDSN